MCIASVGTSSPQLPTLISAIKPLVPRSRWYYKILVINNLLVLQEKLYQERVGAKK